MSSAGARKHAVDAEILHLGCGDDYRENAHNVDVNKDVRADSYADLTEPWPFPDSCVRRVEAHHVLEHLADPSYFFEESARVLRDGGAVVVTLPIGLNARTDLDHEHEWTYETFRQFSREHRRPWDPKVPFELEKREIRIWHEGPLGRPVCNRITRWLAARHPGQWTSQWPASSGEITATYRRFPR